MKRKIFNLRAPRFWKENYLILRELKYFPKTIALALIFTILYAILQGIGIGFILTFLQSLTQPEAPPIQSGINWIDTYVLGVHLSDISRIYRVSLMLFVITIFQVTSSGLSTFYSGVAQSHLVLRIQKRTFEQLQALNINYFTQIRSGDLVNSVTTEIAELKNVLETISFIIVRSTILIAYLTSILWISWQLTFLIIIFFYGVSKLLSKLFLRIRKSSFKTSTARSEYTSIAMEFISGIRTIQVSSAQMFELDKINRSAFKVFQADKESWETRAVIEPIPEALVTLITLTILIFSFKILIPRGELEVASLLTFLFVIIRTLPIVRQLNNARGRLNKYQGAIRATKKLLSTDGKSFFKNGNQTFQRLKQEIKFNSVDFSYSYDQPVLNNISFTIKSGEMTALVGSSGAGKTTIADLIPRFYDPIQGSVLVDGVDLREIDINSWRQAMAVVSQDTFIFNSTVRENIAYSLDLEKVSDTDILEAAKMANAFEFIQALPNGLDTSLGDRGVLLSGGQRQRIAIARALLRNPQILILDEATSALDSVTERLIQESIEKLAVGRTVIAIAHRLSTISRADQIVVLEKGCIVEQGKYQELLEKKSHLWRYHQMQK